jgi:hypothetical protein
MEINKKNWLLKVFLIFYLLFAILTYQDYGINWDENDTYSRGEVYFNYFARGFAQGKFFGNEPNYLIDRQEAPGLTLYNHAYSAVLFLFNQSRSYEKYHLLNLLFASSIFLASYLIIYRQYQKQAYAILGPIFLFLTPRFLGHLPTNSRDATFAIFYFLSLAGGFLILKSEKRLFLKIVLVSFCFGLAQAQRIVGYFLYPILAFFVFYTYFLQPAKKRKTLFNYLKSKFLTLLLVFVLANALTFFIWPYLRTDFPNHLMEILKVSKRFFWRGQVLFRGEKIWSDQIPVSYLPTWILITTPVFLLFFLFFPFIFLKNRLKNPLFVLMGLVFFGNFALYFLLRPVLYDGLRHFLFLLPILVTMATIGLIEFFKNCQNQLLKILVLGLVVTNISSITIQLIKLHPYQYLYFNEFVGGLNGAYGRFETDYYGLSFKEAIGWLIKNEITNPEKVYKIKTCGHHFSSSYYFKSNMERAENLQEADYFVCYTRFDQHLEVADEKTIFVVKRQGVPLNYVKKLR